MNRLVLLVTALALGLSAQRIETETPSREKVVRVQTAMNHLTVIELAEPVDTVAVGSESFKVERRGNKVFIQPLEEGVSTNLFIWAGATRLNYELVPAVTDAGRMDFAIDYRKPVPAASVAPPAAVPARRDAAPDNWLLRSQPVKQVGFGNHETAGVNVTLRDVYCDGNRVFIRYFIENHSPELYRTGSPRVRSLRSPVARWSLYTLANSQLGDQSGLRYATAAPVTVESAPEGGTQIAPGERQVGIVSVLMPNEPVHPTVLELQFAATKGRTVKAVLVL